VNNVPYTTISRSDGTPARKRPADAPLYRAPRKRRMAGGGAEEYRWRHEGIWSSFLEPVVEGAPPMSMENRMKYRISIALFVGGKWVDIEEPEVLSLADIMQCDAEEREMHLKALVEFTQEAFHADASAAEFKEWFGDVDTFGGVNEAVQVAREETYGRHAQFFAPAAHGGIAGNGGADLR